MKLCSSYMKLFNHKVVLIWTQYIYLVSLVSNVKISCLGIQHLPILTDLMMRICYFATWSWVIYISIIQLPIMNPIWTIVNHQTGNGGSMGLGGVCSGRRSMGRRASVVMLLTVPQGRCLICAKDSISCASYIISCRFIPSIYSIFHVIKFTIATGRHTIHKMENFITNKST